MSLHPIHHADLIKSGLSDQIVKDMQVYSMPPAEIVRRFPKKAEKIESALAFPYFDIEGKRNGFLRIKVFPDFEENGHTTKYLQMSGTPVHLYILPTVIELIKNQEQTIFIVEGEKKTAKVIEAGLCAVGIGGLWSWSDGKTNRAIDDFQTIKWSDRKVIIVPDSDTFADNKKSIKLRHAVYALARELVNSGASVKVKVLPND